MNTVNLELLYFWSKQMRVTDAAKEVGCIGSDRKGHHKVFYGCCGWSKSSFQSSRGTSCPAHWFFWWVAGIQQPLFSWVPAPDREPLSELCWPRHWCPHKFSGGILVLHQKTDAQAGGHEHLQRSIRNIPPGEPMEKKIPWTGPLWETSRMHSRTVSFVVFVVHCPLLSVTSPSVSFNLMS